MGYADLPGGSSVRDQHSNLWTSGGAVWREHRGWKINLGFGYDTFGIQKFIESNKVIDIFDGFYIKDFDSNGNDRDELRLYGEVFAGVVIDLFVAEVGVRGGLGLEVGFDLNDPNQDGRVRISEIISQAQIDPRCIFNIHGEIYVFLEAFLTVDLFFFKIEETWESLVDSRCSSLRSPVLSRSWRTRQVAR